jgi:hypothetical protein
MKATSKVKRGHTLKQGSITSTNELNLIRRMPDMTGACPLLLADLSECQRRGSPRERASSLPISTTDWRHLGVLAR